MDAEMQRRIKQTVGEILKGADMTETTEFNVRTMASMKLGIDLSIPERKRFVRQVVESFLISSEMDEVGKSGQENEYAAAVDDAKVSDKFEREEEDEREREEKEEKGNVLGKEYDDDGNLIVCRVRLLFESDKRL